MKIGTVNCWDAGWKDTKDAGIITWKDDFGNTHTAWFSYTDDVWALKHGLIFQIWFNNEIRFAKVLKTVVHVAVDEDEYGNPVIEKWKCKTTFYKGV